MDNIYPSLSHISTDILAKKTTLKNAYGVFELEEYEVNNDGCFEFAYKVNLKLKDLKPEVAIEIIRAVTPFFEDPISPQLTLFPKEENNDK